MTNEHVNRKSKALLGRSMYRKKMIFACLIGMGAVHAHAMTAPHATATGAAEVMAHDSRQAYADPNLLQEIRRQLGAPSIDLRVWRRYEHDDVVVLRLQQFFEGMLVWNSVVIVHTDSDERVVYIDGSAVRDLSGAGLTSQAGISKEQAEQLVRDFYASTYPDRTIRSIHSDYYDEPIIFYVDEDSVPKVGYLVLVNGSYVVVVDVNTGEILEHWNSVRQ